MATGGTDFVLHFRNSDYAVATSSLRERYWFAEGAWLELSEYGAPVEIALTQWLADRGVEVSGTTFDEEYARELHSESQRAANITDPEAGSQMDATLEILRTRGLIESVLYCRDETDIELAMLERGPVVLSMVWHQSMFKPELVDGHTVCRVDLDTGVVGGHVVLLNGISLDLKLGGTTGYVRMKNSWGRSWGDNGNALISLADLAKLMESGSAFLPIPPAQVLAAAVSQQMAPEESAVTFERYQQAAIASDLWTTQDSLGYAAYADAIARGIQHKDTRPPLTIGIKAPWGAGKTSLMRMVRDRLEWPGGDQAARHPDEPREISFAAWSGKRTRLTYRAVLKQLRRDPEPLVMAAGPDPYEPRWRPTVWFNPWTYQTTQQVWAGLAHEIITQITDRMKPAERERFWFHLNLRRIDEHAVRRRIYAIILGRVLPVAFSALVLLIVGLVLLAVGMPRWIGLVVTGGSPVALGLAAVWQAFRVLRTKIGGPLARLAGPAAELPEPLVRAPDYHKDAGYLAALQQDLRHVLGLVARPEQPLVVFIDDLDRCAPSTVVQVIEAVNSFLAGDFPDAIFVIALEPRMVAAHIETAYADLAEKLGDGGGLGWRFLDKFIQLPLTLPVVDADQSTVLLSSLFPVIPAGEPVSYPPGTTFVSALVHGLIREIARRPDMVAKEDARRYVDRQLSTDSPEIQRVIEFGARMLESNPRALKRFVNVFRFFVMIHTERRLHGLPTPDSRDALDTLAKLSVLAVRWPDLLTSLIERSENGLSALDMVESDQPVPNLDSAKLKEFLRTGPRIAQHAHHYL